MKKIFLYLILLIIDLTLIYFMSIIWIFTVLNKMVGETITIIDVLLSTILIGLFFLLIFLLINVISHIKIILKK